MAGKIVGKGGKIGIKRFKINKKTGEDLFLEITKPAIRRLARRGGVKRLSQDIYAETRDRLKNFLEDVIRDTIVYTEHGKRKTVTTMDVVYGLKRNNIQLYGSNQVY